MLHRYVRPVSVNEFGRTATSQISSGGVSAMTERGPVRPDRPLRACADERCDAAGRAVALVA
jgi:hypothetical protein